MVCFNPRAHAGRDAVAESADIAETVSIHAPTRGATLPQRVVFKPTGFNPRAHAGRDINYYKTYDDAISFNPRAHAGRDYLHL